MRDDASLRRLAEIGIDVYVPRVAQAHIDAAAAMSSASRPSRGARVVLLARPGDARHALVVDVQRALAFAHIEAAVESAVDERGIGDAAGLVVFGEALAREAAGALPAQRRQTLAWASAADPAALGRNASAKRGLWSELKRLTREAKASAHELDSGRPRP